MNAKQQGLAGVIRRHPIGAFLGWFFTVGQAFVFTPLVFDVDISMQWFINASTLFGLLLPALVITRIVDGREGLRDLGGRIFRLRVPVVVALVGIIAMPLLAIGLALALLGAPTVPASTSLSAIASVLIVSTVVGLVLNNLWEEVAWMGFVQARLQSRHGPMRAALLTAPLFALQHIALIVENDAVTAAVILVAFMIVTIPYRAFAGWVYNRSGGSLLPVGLIHALGNAVGPGSGFAGGYLRRLYPADADLVGVLHIAAFALIGLAVMAATRGRLGLRGQGTPEVETAHALVAEPAR